jgi:hypothetical protein
VVTGTYAAAIKYEHAHGKWKDVARRRARGEGGGREATPRTELKSPFHRAPKDTSRRMANVDKIAHKTGRTEEAKITYL